MQIIYQDSDRHEIDDTTDTHYVLSLKVSYDTEPIVIHVERSFEAFRDFLINYDAIYKNMANDDPHVLATQKAVIYWCMIWLTQCVHRAWDVDIIEQVKEAEETKHLFDYTENDNQRDSKKVNLTRERSTSTIDLEGIFKSFGVGEQWDKAAKKFGRAKWAGNKLKRERKANKAAKKARRKNR